jgi:hypothetical protein
MLTEIKVDFGLVLPRMSLLATIGFTYSVLTPFINVMALVSFVMFYIAWKYRAFSLTST